MPTIDDYNGIPMEQTTETNYNYNVGGEVKKTIPFTKELREWLLMFKSRGIRFADTIDELRLFTKHENKQMFGVIENGSIYQYQLVTTTDDGENAIKPDNVYSYNTGRWIKVLSFSNEIVNLWSQMQYVGVWGNNPVPISATDTTYYIDNANGIDNTTIDGTMAHPFKTIAYAISRFGVTNHYWNGKLTLNLLSDYTDTISILNYFNSDLVINAGTFDISEIEMYGNGNISLSGEGEIGELRSTLNNNIYVGGFTFNPSPVNRAFIDDYNVTLGGCFIRGIITIQDCKGTVKLGGLTIYPTFYVDLLRCKAHISVTDGDIQANYCFITRTLSPYINGSHNVISDMDAFNDIFIPTTEQELVNNATTLGEINLYEKYYVKSISCPNLVSCDLVNIQQKVVNGLKFENINFPLIEIADYINIGNTNIAILDLSSLENSTEIRVEANELLTSVDLSSLVSVDKQILISGNGLLTDITISNTFNCLDVGFNKNALSVSCIDDILNKLDIAGYEDGTLVLNGGTNAIPSASGLVSKSNLEGKGWTVTVNS